MCRDAILEKNFIQTSSKLLNNTEIDPELILEFLSSLCNASDDAKYQLALNCKNLLNILDRVLKSDEDIDLLKSLTDLVVLLFAGGRLQILLKILSLLFLRH